MKTKNLSTKQQGHIKKWQDDKGFGFIETAAGESVFFHVSAFKAQRRPEIGEQVVFIVGQDNQGRLQAKDVQELSFVQQKMAQKNRQIRQRNHKRSAQAEFEAGQKKRLFLGIGFYGAFYIFINSLVIDVIDVIEVVDGCFLLFRNRAPNNFFNFFCQIGSKALIGK